MIVDSGRTIGDIPLLPRTSRLQSMDWHRQVLLTCFQNMSALYR